MTATTSHLPARGTFWAAALTYLLIAFEFFYMATPFAAYFYSVYRPSLGLLGRWPALAWLSGFFLPHIVIETRSTLVDAHNAVGAGLMLLGLLAFGIGAAQVYSAKLRKRGAVSGGLYRFVRHPQYGALIVAGFGLLLAWPRFTVLILYVVMLFAYRLLAKVEEGECEARFGAAYVEYRERTPMFLPIRVPVSAPRLRLPRGRSARVATQAAIFFVVVGASLLAARSVQAFVLTRLSACLTDDSVYVSVTRRDDAELRAIVEIALGDPEVQKRLMQATPTEPGPRFINYVLPTTWYVPEIPMNMPPGSNHHELPSDYDRSLCKVVFTRAETGARPWEQPAALLTRSVHRVPLFETWLDRTASRVTRVMEPPSAIIYENMPVAVY